MNILIVGDSWSKPDGYSRPSIVPYTNQTILPLEYYLLSKGHTVYNRGEGGRGNCNSLLLAEYFLAMAPAVNINIDLLIFFNTDLSRDRHEVYGWPQRIPYPKTLTEVTESIFEHNIKCLDRVKALYKGKWAIIGGCASFYKPDFYSFADFIIEDWRSEILGYKVETSQWLYDYPFLENTINDIDVIEKEADKIEKIWDATKSRLDLFPDGSHPSMMLQQQLGERIHNHFTGSN